MIPYMSYWCGGYRRHPSDFFILMHKVACHLAKKSYGECHLLTDEKGAKIFKDVGFSSIEVLKSLDKLPSEYHGEPWSWSKIVTYNYLATQKIHFIHFDYDVFLWKKIPEFIERADVFAQHLEPNVRSFYNVPHFERLCKEQYLMENSSCQNAANCGIFGGNNFDFIKTYSSSAMDLILDPKNKLAWKDRNYSHYWCKATIAEQFYLNVASEHYKVPITYLLSGDHDNKETFNKQCQEYGYTHVWGAKNNQYWQDKIKQLANTLGL